MHVGEVLINRYLII
jgi:serine/threonine-protein kinase SRPK3